MDYLGGERSQFDLAIAFAEEGVQCRLSGMKVLVRKSLCTNLFLETSRSSYPHV